MPKMLIVTADEAVARLICADGLTSPLKEVRTLTAPEAHAPGTALRQDAHGRRSAGGRVGTSTTESAALDASHEEADRFARRVADELDGEVAGGEFHEVRIAAAPRFLGLLRQHYSARLKQALTLERDANYVKADDAMVKEKLVDAQRPALR